MELDIVAKPEEAATIAVALGVIECGFQLLKEKYPEHVRVGRNFKNKPVQ